MINLLVWGIALLLAVWTGIALHQDSGYLMIAYQSRIVEMPLWLGVVILVLGFTLFVSSIFLFHQLGQVGGYIAEMGRKRQKRRARDKTNRGLIAFAEGHWDRAEKLLVRGATHSETPLLNYLTAARAAQEQGHSEHRDRYLRMAHDATPGTDIAVGLTQAQLQLNQGQLEQSLATLNHLRHIAPQHPHVLKLLCHLYEQVSEWEALADLLPELNRGRIISKEERQALEARLYEAMLTRLSQEGSRSLENMQALWKRVPKSIQNSPLLVEKYSKALLASGHVVEAEQIIRLALKRCWSKDLIRAYGEINAGTEVKQLQHAEQWLKAYENDPELLLTLGRLCLREQLWGKAQSYLEGSLSLKDSPEVHAELGRLFDRMGESAKSQQHYRKGLLTAYPVIPLDREAPIVTRTED